MDALANTPEVEELKEVSLSSLSAKTIIKTDDKKTPTCESGDGEKSAGPSTKTTRLPVPTSNSFTRSSRVSPHKIITNKMPSKIPRSQSLKRNENDFLAKNHETNEPKKEVGKKEKELNSEVKTTKRKPEPITKKSLPSNKSSDTDSETASMKSCESTDVFTDTLNVMFNDAEQDIWDDTVAEEIPKETELRKTEKTKVVKVAKDKEPRKNLKIEESPKVTKDKETREPPKDEVPKVMKSRVPRKIVQKKSKEKDLPKIGKEEDSLNVKEKEILKVENHNQEHQKEIKEEKSILVLKNVEKFKSVKEYEHPKENKGEEIQIKSLESSHVPKNEEIPRVVKDKSFQRTQKKEEPSREGAIEKSLDDTENEGNVTKEKKILTVGKNEKSQIESKNRKSQTVIKDKESFTMTKDVECYRTKDVESYRAKDVENVRTKDVENFRTKEKEMEEKEISSIERDREVKKGKVVVIEPDKIEEKSIEVVKHQKVVEAKRLPKILKDEESKKAVEIKRSPKVTIDEKSISEITDGKSITSLKSFETSEEKNEREKEAEEREMERQKRVINTLYDVTKHAKRCLFENVQGLDKFLKDKPKPHVVFSSDSQEQQSQEGNSHYVQESYDNTLREITDIWKNTVSLVGSVKDHTHKFVDEKNAFIDKEQLTLEAEMLQLAVDFAITYSKLKTDFLLSGILKHLKVKVLEKSELENFLEWKAFVAQYNNDDLAAMAKTVLELKTSIIRGGEFESE